MMTTKRRILVMGTSLGLLSLFAAVLLPTLASPSNCGRNSYALGACRQIAGYVLLATTTNGSEIDLSRLNSDDQANLLHIAQSHWTAGAGYWVRTNDLRGAAQKQVIVVCDTVYDNVPQPALWNFYRRNPAHAVGFSDGSAGLISPAEFDGLDRKSFLNLSANGKARRP